MIVVFYRLCTTEGCNGICKFDGYFAGLLNMGKVLIAHEIFKRHLLSFVLGRYMY